VQEGVGPENTTYHR